jgi:hypothetical protein
MIPVKPCLLAVALLGAHAHTTAAVLSSPIAARALLASATAGALAVTNCDDHGPGSLRDAFARALTGDTIDLRDLTCSRISLQSEISDPSEAQYVQLLGNHNVTITRESPTTAMRLIRHTSASASSQLTIQGLTLTDGLTADGLGGACVYSAGDLAIVGSVVSGCEIRSGQPILLGGALHAEATLRIYGSQITDSGISTTSASTNIRGGGAFGYTMRVSDSYIGRNHLTSPNTDVTHVSIGGGLYTRQLTMSGSTVANNAAHIGGGLGLSGRAKYSKDCQVVNSTISGNNAESAGGIYAGVLLHSLHVYNSTIAYNTAPDGAGARLNTSNVTLVSSIVSANSGGDFSGGNSVVISGSHNLIGISQISVPDDTIVSSEPRLGPLATYGSALPAHAPLTFSPAIDHGSNPLSLQSDEQDNLREQGYAPDIGAVEFRDKIFKSGFEIEQ